MNEKSLQKNLANLERELVNLQTAHDVGLGAISFYTYQGDFWTFTYGTSTPMAILLIDVVDGERSDPLLDVYFSSIYEDNDPGFAYVERVNGRKFDYYTMKAMAGGTQTHMWYKVVASSKLTVRPATSWEDFEEWLNG